MLASTPPCLADPAGSDSGACAVHVSFVVRRAVASHDDFHYSTSRCLAVVKTSTHDPYDGMRYASYNAQGAPGRLAGTPRKDERMQVTPRLTIDIVSDIV